MRIPILVGLSALFLSGAGFEAGAAEKMYGPGVTDTEIKIGQTVPYSGPASAEQIKAFGSAFGGATSLRRETIAQFTHIADFIGEDELVGFGLYQSDQESEPSDWRCLSRRDALRFADEICLLGKAVGESGSDAPLPAVMNGSVGGRRLFKDRREREALAIDPAKWIRDVESTLLKRIGLLESQVEAHAHTMPLPGPCSQPTPSALHGTSLRQPNVLLRLTRHGF